MTTNQKNEINKDHCWLTLITSIILLALSPFTMAYVGPGAGLSLIGSLIGVVVAIFMALTVIISWPLRLLIRRIRRQRVKNPTIINQNVDVQSANLLNSNDS